MSFAWGRDGHTAIGILAVNQLQQDALHELESIIRPLSKEAMAEECNWPDVMRENEDGAWSAPLHYINIPRGVDSYDQVRDCPLHPERLDHPEGPAKYCVTEAIKHYAAGLGNSQASNDERRQAFAWLCHLVGLTSPFPTLQADSNWSQEMVNDWTSESHRIADQAAYPPKKKIKKPFEEQSWELTQRQIELAASRLALIINTELHQNE